MPESFRRKIPPGSEGLALESSFRRLHISRELAELFTLWGYLPVHTPLVDFFEPYRGLVNPEQVYRFTDREGDLLFLRNDATLFLARVLGLQLGEISQPLRIWYSDSILRHANPDDPSSDEFFQAGAEYIGARQGEADWEMILLATEVLEKFGLPEWRVHLGSRALFRFLTRPRDALHEAELLRDTERTSGPAWDALSPEVRRSLQFIGTPSEAESMLEKQIRNFTQEEQEQVLFWTQTARILEENGLKDRVVLDLSEAGRMPYYTGLVFRFYSPSLGEPAVTGGRYDTLLSRFGVHAPSVGFSFQQSVLEKVGVPGESLVPAVRSARGHTWAERLSDARFSRAKGEVVAL